MHHIVVAVKEHPVAAIFPKVNDVYMFQFLMHSIKSLDLKLFII